MSRIKNIRKDSEEYCISIFSAIEKLFLHPKFSETFFNLTKKDRWKQVIDSSFEDCKYRLKKYWGMNDELSEMSKKEIFFLERTFEMFFSYDQVELYRKFISLYEKKLIEEKDLTKYNSFDFLRAQVSIAELKSIDKELAKQIRVIQETPEWILLKPLSWESSRKYGANTRWCTTSEKDSSYFYKYSQNGVLIYYINKKLGEKIAVHKHIETNDITFWNVNDERVDSITLNMSEEVMSLIKEEILKKEPISNWDLLTFEEQQLQLKHLIIPMLEPSETEINERGQVILLTQVPDVEQPALNRG
jgi:hypothetical protein